MAHQQPPLAVCIPLSVDAFILNEHVVNSGKAVIAPFSLPDYGGLEPGDRLQHDVIPHLNLRSATVAKTNDRLSDLDSGESRRDRLGVYLHWTIPKPFRTGLAASESASDSYLKERTKKGLPKEKRETTTGSTEFVAVPDRWIVIRRIHTSTPAQATYAQFSAFVIESNRVRRLDREEFAVLDLDTEAAPFVDHQGTTNAQHGVFLGAKYHLEDWQGVWDPAAVDPQSFHIPLTIADSANPLFTDFQHHCMNVFAMHDDLTYYSVENNTMCTLESADISYLVLGYHGLEQHDPLANGEVSSNSALLSTHGMKLRSEEQVDWLKSQPKDSRIRSLCHGRADHVVWSLKQAPRKIPADEVAEHFARLHPVAVGTDLLDALTASYLSPADPKKADAKLAAAFKHLEILAANPSDDGSDSSQGAQQKASHYRPAHGGHTWKLKKVSNTKKTADSMSSISSSSSQPTVTQAKPTSPKSTTNPKTSPSAQIATKLDSDNKPPAETLQMLHDLNSTQKLLDSATRHYHLLQHLLFCEWWKARAAGYGDSNASTSDELDDGFHSMRSWYKTHLNETRSRLRRILGDLMKLNRGDGKSGILVTLAAHIGELRKHGPRTIQAPAARFFSTRDPTILLSEMESSWPDDFTADNITVQLNTELSDSRKQVPQNDEAWQIFQGKLTTLPSWVHGCVDDLRHDWLRLEVEKGTTASAERNNAQSAQAWFPLFIEWEADYFHIPIEHWKLQETGNGTVKYGIKRDAKITGDPKITTSRRGLSGRSAIFPEGQRSLSTLVDQMSPPTRACCLFKGVSRSKDGQLFRPVTHGQVRFTKLNIVDKFGQVVCAFDPRPGQPFRPIYPSVSEDMACQRSHLAGRVFANTALPEPEGRSQFFQLGPRVNQNIRFNATFVVQEYGKQEAGQKSDAPSKTNGSWRSLLEWENPIWGWVVCNFQDDSLQVFQGDGTLCGEILVGSPTNKGLWLNPDADSTHAVPTVSNPELAAFMERLSSSNEFLHKVWNMVVDANEHIHHAPSTLADFLPALIGRPLALVSMGWSLELATMPMVDQSDSRTQQDMGIFDYKFDLKLGDQMSLHDGLVAYFLEDGEASDKGSSFTFNEVHTTYGLNGVKRGLRRRKGVVSPSQTTLTGNVAETANLPSSASSTSSVINTPSSGSTVSEAKPVSQVVRAENIPFTPYWIDPMQYGSAKIEEFAAEHHRKLRIFGALVDPFQSINGFSGILPTTSLSIPPWALDSALKKMETFIRVGPLLIPSDLPTSTPPDLTSTEIKPTSLSVASPTATLPIDAPAEGSWTWIQPVQADATDFVNQKFKLVPTSKQFIVPDGPKTAVEGFLRLISE
ncbi:uncharacterized protein BHQ10_004282 [Talaromyces amestolkiae]|uniref:Uncharacterized protein n=1 Tax=Talaromyces amestolkiae TaxID=1196081 RepID=A0A364KXJ2_TALAM|nr:uncharacterized protein BHQ10_004282 [Talaromyces amestolkiae]RAO68270.1 hypothetical protein BHQ10_004282 [Talaromyces amestolkiae]